MTPQRFTDIMVCAGYRPATYSGRGMFGTRCVGVHVPRCGESEFGAALLTACKPEEQSEVISVLANHSEASLGMDKVLYWRSMPSEGVEFPEIDV